MRRERRNAIHPGSKEAQIITKIGQEYKERCNEGLDELEDMSIQETASGTGRGVSPRRGSSSSPRMSPDSPRALLLSSSELRVVDNGYSLGGALLAEAKETMGNEDSITRNGGDSMGMQSAKLVISDECDEWSSDLVSPRAQYKNMPVSPRPHK
jgi:hypothetical protein